jgi:hypothetical protein
MIKLTNLLKEIIDIYSPEELNSKDIEYRIDRDSPTRFRVELKYKDQYYVLSILPLFNPKRPSINFGSSDEKYENLNLTQLLNSPYSSRILAAVFGLIRYWVDKHNIQQFEYGADGNIRIKLYDYYLTKHFPDFKNTNQVELIDSDIFIWEKKI